MKVRVLHVLPTRASSYGGPVRVAETLARHAASHDIDSALFPPAGHEPSHRLLFAPPPGVVLRLIREVRAASLLHVHGLWTVPTSLAATLARAFRKPYILTPHGMLDRWSLHRSAAKKRLYASLVERSTVSGARALHFFTQEEAEEAAGFGVLPEHFLLPNGVDLSTFAALPSRAELDARWPVVRGKRVALFLGRIHPKKGFDVLLPALARANLPDVLLVVAGPDEGGYRREVEQHVHRLGLGSRVLFTGSVDGEDKRLLLGGADLFVLPSHQEGDSVAIKEALAAGLPLLISNRCHFPEVESSGAGLVVPDEAGPTAEALSRLFREDLRSRRAAARELARSFDAAALASRAATVYRAVAEGRPLPR